MPVGVGGIRVGVVGHVEWIEFLVVERIPREGEIVHAREAFADAAGGGGVAAVQMARLTGAAEIFCSIGDDALGARARDRLTERGVAVRCAEHPRPQRRGFTYLDDAHERTITIIGDRLVPHGADPLPWERLDALDAVYVTGGDAGAIRAARRARAVVATPRAAPGLVEAGIELDALVMSATDANEQGIVERLRPEPRLLVRTRGAEGGEWHGHEGRTGAFHAAKLPGPPVDSYGCGDTFAAALTIALGAGAGVADALRYAAECGAAVLTGRGPYGADLAGITL